MGRRHAQLKSLLTLAFRDKKASIRWTLLDPANHPLSGIAPCPTNPSTISHPSPSPSQPTLEMQNSNQLALLSCTPPLAHSLRVCWRDGRVSGRGDSYLRCSRVKWCRFVSPQPASQPRSSMSITAGSCLPPRLGFCQYLLSDFMGQLGLGC